METDLDRWYRVSIGLSRGEGQPQPLARLELTTVELQPGGRAIAALRPLRARPTLLALLEGTSEQALPDAARALAAKVTVEILSLRPTMCYGL